MQAFTTDAGVDVLSFGGTKNGLLFGEAVIWLNPQSDPGMSYLRKMNMQLASKIRFVSAQLVALLTDGLWLRSASHANEMAQRLSEGISAINGVSLTQATQSNGVFAVLHPGQPRKSGNPSASMTGTKHAAKSGGCAPEYVSPIQDH